MKVKEALHAAAMDRGLRQSTVISYERLLGRLGLLDQEVEEVTAEVAMEALWTIDSPNTRRSAAIALRAVCGLSVRVPRAVPRRYDLPSEDTLRLALMTSPHEVRFLLMLYGCLRVGEAAAVTGHDVRGDRLRVDKQVVEITQTGKPTIVRVGPVKTHEAEVVLPHWLCPLVQRVQGTTKPSILRESLRRAGRKVGVDLNPHQLRHAGITMLLERGVPVAAVSRHARHSDVATTLRTYAQHDQGRAIHDAWG